MTDLADAFRFQAKACRDLGSPFMGQLMDLLALRLRPGTALTDRLFSWEGDIGPRGESLPLRLAGALHRLRLEGNKRLAAVYPPQRVSDDVLWETVEAVLAHEAAAINGMIDSPPQTNEVRRSAMLIAGAHFIAAEADLPLSWFELGASAGLNLNWDRYGLRIGEARFGPPAPALNLTPSWAGPLPAQSQPVVAERAGVDLRPLDPQADRLRLLSYLWPDQPDRLALTDAAIAVADTKVEGRDAIDWLSERLTLRPGHWTVIAHTIAWQYFPQKQQEVGKRLIERVGADATAQTPLAWLSIENDGGPRGAAMTLRLWPGDRQINLGRADFHGRWIDWDPRPM